MKSRCEICGAELKAFKSTIYRKPRRFCSTICLGLHNRKRVEVACKYCGKKVFHYPSTIKNGGGIFCSRKCTDLWKSKNPVREGHWNWKGGATSEVVKMRRSLNYRIWRKSVFERDNYTCLECGERGGRLVAHHDKKFSEIFNEIKTKFPILSALDVSEQYGEMWHTSNGTTLCEYCHKEKHRRK